MTLRLLRVCSERATAENVKLESQGFDRYWRNLLDLSFNLAYYPFSTSKTVVYKIGQSLFTNSSKSCLLIRYLPPILVAFNVPSFLIARSIYAFGNPEIAAASSTVSVSF